MGAAARGDLLSVRFTAVASDSVAESFLARNDLFRVCRRRYTARSADVVSPDLSDVHVPVQGMSGVLRGRKESAMESEPLESEPLRFVHAANIRFGVHIGQVAGWTPAQRTVVAEAGLRAFENLMDVCLETQADFLLVTGDSCADATDWRIAVAVRRGLQRLNQHGVHVFVASAAGVGSQVWTVCGDDFDNLTVLDADDAEPVAFLRGRHAVAALQNHILFDSDGDLAEPDSTSGGTIDSAGRQPFRIGILAVDSKFSISADAPDLEERDRVESKTAGTAGDEPTELLPAEVVAHFEGVSLVDYVALAHGDRPRRVRMRSRDQIANFPGTLQPLGFGEADWGGCTVVDVDQRGQVECRQVDTSAVDWVSCELIWRPGAMIPELAAGALYQIQQHPPGASARLCVVRWDVHLAEPGQVKGGAEFESAAIDAFEKAWNASHDASDFPAVVHHWDWTACASDRVPPRSGMLSLLDDAWDQMPLAADAELRRIVHAEFAADDAMRGAMDMVLDAGDVATLRAGVNQLVEHWFESPADQGAA